MSRRSLRVEMLQVARLGAHALGESAQLVRDRLLRTVAPCGGGPDRDGRDDLYYTIFWLACLEALSSGPPNQPKTQAFIESHDSGEDLDLIHLGALARCRAALGLSDKRVEESLLKRIESFRSLDGGYDATPTQPTGNAYAAFVAFGAHQDLGHEIPAPLDLVQSLKRLESRDGAWGNVPALPRGSTNPTAAAVTLLSQLQMPLNATVADWLLGQVHPQGGFMAMPLAPIPDLLSTATALHALACLETPIPSAIKEACLDFIDSLWSAEGGFHGHWNDDHLDAEYTFYGLLALGHLS
jgi:prenyltransferase beta subunit